MHRRELVGGGRGMGWRRDLALSDTFAHKSIKEKTLGLDTSCSVLQRMMGHQEDQDKEVCSNLQFVPILFVYPNTGEFLFSRRF